MSGSEEYLADWRKIWATGERTEDAFDPIIMLLDAVKRRWGKEKFGPGDRADVYPDPDQGSYHFRVVDRDGEILSFTISDEEIHEHPWHVIVRMKVGEIEARRRAEDKPELIDE